jgi:hypothetical protein
LSGTYMALWACERGDRWVFRSMRMDIPLDLNKDSGRMGIGIPLA